MGYDIRDDGTHLRLDREVPHCLARCAPDFVRSFLDEQHLSTDDVGWWIFHPGGAKILHALESSFNLTRDRTRWGWDVLKENGNMSSASVLFALAAFIRDAPFRTGDKALMLGVGPGLTLEAILFGCQEASQ
jgi:alkylresorcinol/alkylpyrone synthase